MLNGARTHKMTVWLIVASSIVLSILSFFIPVVPTVTNPDAAHLRMAIAILLMGLFIGSAVWFFTLLHGFKTRMRIAYILFGVGMILFATAVAQLPVLGLFDLWNSVWVTSGAIVIIFIAGTLFMYLGLRLLARLLGEKNIATSFLATTGIAVVFAVVVYLITPYLMTYELADIETYTAAVGFGTTYLLFATLLARRVHSTIGESYHKAIWWQIAALGMLTFAGLHEMFGTMVTAVGNPFQDYGFYLWPFIVAAVLFLKASYEFGLLTTQQREGTFVEAGTAATNNEDYLKSIVTLATMASRAPQIDPILDEMRAVTSATEPGNPFTGEQKTKLMHVYSRLEAYLMNDDPLRTFTKEEIRKKVTRGFAGLLK